MKLSIDPGRPGRGLVIVGTDTGVGKTKVTSWLAGALARKVARVGVCKPAVTGAQSDTRRGWVWEDLESLRAACRLDVPDEWICPFRWIAPLSPPMAAVVDAANNRNGFPGSTTTPATIDDYLRALDVWEKSCDFLLVEGIGGLLCPLTEKETFLDLATALSMPLVVVAHLGLGTINHTLLTLQAAHRQNLRVACVVLNRTSATPDGIAERTNREALMKWTSVPILEPLPFQAESEPIPQPILAADWLAMASYVANPRCFDRGTTGR